MIELRSEELEVARPLYAEFPYKRAFIGSVFEGHQVGRVFVDSFPDPTAAALFHPSTHALLAGDPSCDDLWSHLVALRPQDVFGRERLIFVAPDEEWNSRLRALKGGSLQEEERDFFSFSGPSAGKPDAGDHQDRQPVARITADLLETPRGMLVGVLKHWPTIEAFEEHGVGRCILTEAGEPISVCYSVTVGEAMAPIQINTLPDHRREGYATRVAQACIHDSLSRGIVPFWECGTDNRPSAALATKLGFQPGGHLSRFWLLQTNG